MASDSLVCDSQAKMWGNTPKIAKLGDGSLIGACGNLRICQAWFRWMQAGLPEGQWPVQLLNNDKTEFTGIHVTLDRRVLYYHFETITTEVNFDFHAIGSGQDIAFGALAMGATVQETIEVVSRFDAYTGGAIQMLHLGPTCATLPNASNRPVRKRKAVRPAIV